MDETKDLRVWEGNLISVEGRFRVRETHDFETRHTL